MKDVRDRDLAPQNAPRPSRSKLKKSRDMIQAENARLNTGQAPSKQGEGERANRPRQQRSATRATSSQTQQEYQSILDTGANVIDLTMERTLDPSNTLTIDPVLLEVDRQNQTQIQGTPDLRSIASNAKGKGVVRHQSSPSVRAVPQAMNIQV